MTKIFEVIENSALLVQGDNGWYSVDLMIGAIVVGYEIYRMNSHSAIGVRDDEGTYYYGSCFREVIVDNYGDEARCSKHLLV